MAINSTYPQTLDTTTTLPTSYAYDTLGTAAEPNAHNDLHDALRQAVLALEEKVGITAAPHVTHVFATAAERESSTKANGTIAWTTGDTSLKVKIAGQWRPLAELTQTVTAATGATALTGWSIDSLVGWRRGLMSQFAVGFTRTGGSFNAFGGSAVCTLPTVLRGTISTPLGCSMVNGPQMVAATFTPDSGTITVTGCSSDTFTVDTGNTFTISFAGMVDT